VFGQGIAGSNDVVRQSVHQCVVEMWPHNDAQAVHFLCIKRHGVRGQDPRSRTFAETSNSVKFLAFFLFSVSVCPGEWKAHVYDMGFITR
jgi:hypothetical protein